MKATGWGGRRSDRHMTRKEKSWRTWRKKARTREKEEGSGSRGLVWSKREAEMENKRRNATWETLLLSQMSKWYPHMQRQVSSSG